MPEEKILILEDVGKILLKKNRRFKRLSVRLAPIKGVWINVPYSISYQEAISFAKENKAWIIDNLKKTERKEKKQTIFTDSTDFKTHYHILQLKADKVTKYSAKLHNGLLEVVYPIHTDILNQALQNFIRKSIIETLHREASYYLPKRIDELAQKCSFSYTSVHIKNTKSRWGSCTHDNKINLCIHLMRLPKELCDMVILHELCHTLVKNHSKDFYDLLGMHCSDLVRKRKEIKNYSTTIF
ncbi:M48 family metallopeptidase [Labilibaculum sp. DW002]|uniref:M48 family metallopeptidase n=1 Tax=Paralabilibaculum antarcticum TaxID=2912572 RepID=A0ABT5VMI0_9BACT|nr:SprT family zinc-dependent metalloprotease [Labilibaculum sp. DW002]MDE5416647.1 M48 family metallopeptidase [Labilibaculum sp. DW002]